MKQTTKIILYQLAILIVILLVWELAVAGSKTASFLYSSPVKIFHILYTDIANGTLLYHTMITLSEVILGFLLGNILGVILGLGLWYSETAFKIAKPYIIIFGSIPIFAIAPILIIWFGTGILSKIVLIALSTFILTMVQSYKGANEVEKERIKMLKTFGASKNQVFKFIVVPSSVTWVMSAIKLNIGFALLGAFIGEFISSQAGLGHYIIVASGLYDISSVFAGIIMIAIVSLILNFIVDYYEKKFFPWAELK